MLLAVLVAREILGACGGKVTRDTSEYLGVGFQPMRTGFQMRLLAEVVETHCFARSTGPRFVQLAVTVT